MADDRMSNRIGDQISKDQILSRIKDMRETSTIYEHELKSLTYELKRAEHRRNRAIDGENEVDIEIAGVLVEYIEYQIGVYEKAQAIDQLAHTYEKYKESHTHDLKSTMGTKAIEIMEEINK